MTPPAPGYRWVWAFTFTTPSGAQPQEAVMPTTHTPGPWHTFAGVLYAGTREAPRSIAKISKFKGRMVGDRVTRIGIGDREREANTLLLAAAPELLEQLKKAYPMIATTSGKAAAQAVIDKATGGAA